MNEKILFFLNLFKPKEITDPDEIFFIEWYSDDNYRGILTLGLGAYEEEDKVFIIYNSKYFEIDIFIGEYTNKLKIKYEQKYEV